MQTDMICVTLLLLLLLLLLWRSLMWKCKRENDTFKNNKNGRLSSLSTRIFVFCLLLFLSIKHFRCFVCTFLFGPVRSGCDYKCEEKRRVSEMDERHDAENVLCRIALYYFISRWHTNLARRATALTTHIKIDAFLIKISIVCTVCVRACKWNCHRSCLLFVVIRMVLSKMRDLLRIYNLDQSSI